MIRLQLASSLKQLIGLGMELTAQYYGAEADCRSASDGMLFSRLCKLKIVLVALLPYLAFAIGSEFLHNDGRENQVCPAASAEVQSSGERGSVNLTSPHSASGHKHSDCPACSWARNNLSAPHIAPAVEHTAAVSGVVVHQCFPHGTGDVRLPSARAPPLS
jgi:hypothetical protein